MKNLSINWKLIVGFGIVILLMLVSTGTSIINVNNLGEQIRLYGQYTVPNMENNWSMRRDLVSAQRYLLRAFMSDDVQAIREELAQAEKDGQSVLNALDIYAENQRSTGYDGQIKSIRGYLEQAGSIRKNIASLLENQTAENLQKAKDMFSNQYVTAFDHVADILIQLSAGEHEQAKEQEAAGNSIVSLAWAVLISVAIFSLLLTVAIVFIIRRSILNPVREIEAVYAEMAKGNMHVQVSYDSRDELGKMAANIRKTNAMLSSYIQDISEKLGQMSQGDMRVNVDMEYIGDFAAIKQAIQGTATALNETLQTINTAAEQVSTGSAQVAGGAQALATGSTEQASSVEELSVAITKIAEQAMENSANVKVATQYVEQAGTGVNAGNEHMKKLTEAMVNIGSASDQITNITKVIEDIAFQTNILALNAAIEAARAGNAGKGFAVVADEVRNLAAKSAEAAKQTAELIQRSTATVVEGTQIAEKTALILHDVAEKANVANENIVKIDQASNEQAIAIEQIKQGLTQVSAVVQTNAATAEENSATSEEMSAQAATLREEVGKFKLNSSYEKGGIGTISLGGGAPKAGRAEMGKASLEKYGHLSAAGSGV